MDTIVTVNGIRVIVVVMYVIAARLIQTLIMDYQAMLNQIPIEHYIKKIKEHEEKRLSFNERIEYWRQYYENAKVHRNANRTIKRRYE